MKPGRTVAESEALAVPPSGLQLQGPTGQRPSRWALACLAGLVAITLVAGGLLAVDLAGALSRRGAGLPGPGPLQSLLFLGCGAMLILSAFTHLLAFLGYAMRLRAPIRPRPAPSAAPVGIVIPAEGAAKANLLRALLSAALQDRAETWIRVLRDPPKAKGNQPDAADAALREALAFLDLPRWVTDDLDAPHCKAEDLAAAHLSLAGIFRSAAADWPDAGPADRVFADRVLRARAAHHSGRATSLAADPPSSDAIEAEVRQLQRLAHIPIETFARKDFLNLSHSTGKAMQINAFLGVMGRRFRAATLPDGTRLVPDPAGEIRYPDAGRILILDPECLLVPECTRALLAEMEAPGNDRVALVHAPSAACPVTAGALPRAAGAAMDLQRIRQIGAARFGAACWPGGIAMLRTRALEELKTEFRERGYRVPCYLPTGPGRAGPASTIALLRAGWSVRNLHERLVYAAAPQDTAAIADRQHRGARGGLTLFPRALACLLRTPTGRRPGETALRLEQLLSPGLLPVALLFLLAVPFHPALTGAALPLATLAVLAGSIWALCATGYRAGDLVRLHGLVLLFFPARIAGAAAAMVPPRFRRAGTASPRRAAARAWRGQASLVAGLLVAALVEFMAGADLRAAFSATTAIALAVAARTFLQRPPARISGRKPASAEGREETPAASARMRRRETPKRSAA